MDKIFSIIGGFIGFIFKTIDGLLFPKNKKGDSYTAENTPPSHSDHGEKNVGAKSKFIPKEKDKYSSESMLDAARSGEFETQVLLNSPERKMYYALIKGINVSQYAICPQVSCGEMFKSKDAHHTINSKRVDICIVDKKDFFKPKAVVEVHGSGHFLKGSGDTVMRDATVKEACIKAGLNYHEYRDDSSMTLKEWIDKELHYLQKTKKPS